MSLPLKCQNLPLPESSMKKSQPKEPEADRVNRPGRPVQNTMPDPIPDTMENIARAVLTTPPKQEHEWKYLKSDS